MAGTALHAGPCAPSRRRPLALRRSAVTTNTRPATDGTKAWCSGAPSVTHAVVSGWNAAGEPCLAAVALDQPGVTVTDRGWKAVGMAASASVNVQFNDARGTPVGEPGDYTQRPGFWQGGAGIAACWFGGAQGIADMTHALSRGTREPHRLAHIGAIDVALAGAAAVLRETATAIDAQPGAPAHALALRPPGGAGAERTVLRLKRAPLAPDRWAATSASRAPWRNAGLWRKPRGVTAPLAVRDRPSPAWTL